MPNKPAPCGLRTRHQPHPFGDEAEEWCDGKQPPEHYDARHRGFYRPELGWWPEILTIRVRCRHRKAGDPVLLEEPVLRQRPRLGWRDRCVADEDTA